MPEVTRSVRLRRAAVLGLGAIVAGGVLEATEFFYVPLVVGLVYLAAAAAGGRRGGLWSTALPLTGWGLGVVLGVENVVDLYDPALFLLGAGLGALACAGLERAGWAVDLLGVSATLVLGGLAFALEREVDLFGQRSTYVALLLLVAGFNLAQALRAPGAQGRAGSATA